MVLLEVKGRGPSSLKDVAKWLHLDKSTTNRVLGSLVEKKYVERARHRSAQAHLWRDQ